MRKTLDIMLICLALSVIAGCNEAVKTIQPDAPPLESHLEPRPDDAAGLKSYAGWAAAYGDTLETRLVYNIALIRHDQRRGFAHINSLHPPVEPSSLNKHKPIIIPEPSGKEPDK